MKKLALVTGGTRGVGLAVCSMLAGNGYDVIATARHAPAGELPAGVAWLPCDVSQPDEVLRLFARVSESYGRLDVLVNNAGIAGADALGDPLDPAWDAVIGTNLSGAYRCTQAALALFPPEGGRLVFIASVLGLRAVPDQVAYTASKHGVVGLAKAFALALAARRITSNAICPGWVDTAMARQRFNELGIDAAEARAGVPTGAIVTPEEVAAAVLYLCSDAARNITGHTLVLDGGTLA
jgi:NAD(P)-dependent dehydrogenase (short-subunit alcohol dehydrogenase family)